MPFREGPQTVVFLVLAGVFLTLAGASGSSPAPLDNRLYDLAVRHWIPPVDLDDVAVVVVDDASLRELDERWPLQRDTWARFLQTLQGHRPAAIAVGAWFERPAPRRATELALDFSDIIRDGELGDLEAGERLAVQLERAAAVLDTDRQLSRALAEAGNVVLGVACIGAANDRVAGRDDVPVIEGLSPPPAAERCDNPSASHPALSASARSQGGLTPKVDADGVIRRYGLMLDVDGGALPSLAVAAIRLARPDDADDLIARWLAVDGGAPRMRYASLEDYTALRFSDVLLGGHSGALEHAFAGKIVFVGVSARGAEDHVRTPRGPGWPGVLVHATGAAEILSGRPLRREGAAATVGSLGGWLLLVLLVGVTRRSDAARVPLLAAAVAAAAWIAVAMLAVRAGWIVPVVPVLVPVALWTGLRLVHVVRRGAEHRRQARSIRTAFQHYLAPTVVDALIAHPDALKLGGERREITAFFSDVKGFTGISESMDPGDLIELLNECLGTMTEIIIEEGGTIDKYIGDAIVAMFGAPLDQPDHAERACRAALRCQARIAELQPAWQARGRPEIRVRIGINSGPALVGNMGSAQRFDYTMLGDTVNQAARLEGTNSAYGTWIMAGESTAERVGGVIALRELDTVRLKGKQRGIRVYEVVGEGTSADTERAARYAEGLAAWRERRWADARAAFGPLAEAGDSPSAVMMARLEGIEADPPPEDWGGVHVMTTK